MNSSMSIGYQNIGKSQQTDILLVWQKTTPGGGAYNVIENLKHHLGQRINIFPLELYLDSINRSKLMLLGFVPHLEIWKNRTGKIPLAFRFKSEYFQKRFSKLKLKPKVIFQVSGLFSARITSIPLILYLDYTMHLALKWRAYAPYLCVSELNMWHELENKLYSEANLIFVAQEHVRKDLLTFYHVDPSKVVISGFGYNDAFDDISNHISQPSILCVLRQEQWKRKGGDVILNAFKKIKKIIPDATLTVLGSKGKEVPGVNWLGKVYDFSKIKQIFAKHYYFCHVPFAEPFGIVYLEAMAAGLAIVASNVDAAPYLIKDGVNGYLVPPGNVDATAEALLQLLKNPSSAMKMGLRSKGVVKWYRWSEISKRLITVMKNRGLI
ncbi:MAG: glycosyltransferase family 4 protein [Candidatus Hodarchaeota archaeon]